MSWYTKISELVKIIRDKAREEGYQEELVDEIWELKDKADNSIEKLTYEAMLDIYKAEIPKLHVEWIQRGREVLSADQWDNWDKVVPTILSNASPLMLRNCLDIIKILNAGDNLDDAKDYLKNKVIQVLLEGSFVIS